MGRGRSQIWEAFKQTEGGAICQIVENGKTCGEFVHRQKGITSTGNFWNHVLKFHPQINLKRNKRSISSKIWEVYQRANGGAYCQVIVNGEACGVFRRIRTTETNNLWYHLQISHNQIFHILRRQQPQMTSKNVRKVCRICHIY